MESLELDPPERRMALPRLFAGSQDGGQDGNGNNGNRHTSQLSPDERRSIGKKLRSRDVRRQEHCPRSVRFVADGAEMAQVNLTKNIDLRLGIEHGVKLLKYELRMSMATCFWTQFLSLTPMDLSSLLTGLCMLAMDSFDSR